MRVFKQSDRIELKLGEIKIKIKPLSYDEKSDVQAMLIEGQNTKNLKTLSDATILSMRYSLKEISGLEDSEGEPYKLEFDETGKLSQSCIDDLLNFELSDDLVKACASYISGIPKEIEGVEFIDKKKPKKKI